jgi:hypothetical protein
MTAQLHISPKLSLPLDAVTETFAILAKRRAGKSNAAVVMAEEMYDHGLPWVAIDPKGDWWGVRAAGDGQAPGLSVLVFGGLHGDVPLEPTAGKLVADLVVDQRLTCVLDVSEMSKADQRRFLIDFADRLYRTNREPLHVFCEEADEYIPQMVRGESAKLVGAFETLVKRGGFRGIGITLITQRSASLNKDVLTQIETLIPMRTPAPQDRKAILAWVDVHDAGKDVVDELPGLADGEAWVFSPQWLGDLVKIRFRRRRTFDSGATPKIGQKVRPPATLADVDLESIKDAMAETIERAKAEDPRALRARVAELERELTAERAKPAPEPTEVRVEVPVLAPEIVDQLEALLEPAVALLGETQETLAKHRAWAEQQLATPKTPLPSRPTPAASTRTPAPEPVRAAPRGPAPAAGQGNRNEPGDGARLGKTERSILSVLAQHGPRTHDQLALLTGYSRKASTIGVALGKLRKVGYVEPGQPITATTQGIEWLGDAYEQLPAGEALIDYWRTKFGLTEQRVLDAVLDTYPGETTQAEIAEVTGYSPTASTIGVALGRLRKVGVVDKWRISDDFAAAAGLDR